MSDSEAAMSIAHLPCVFCAVRYISLSNDIDSEPETDTLLSMMSLSSNVVVSTTTAAPVAREMAPLLPPGEALLALERAITDSFVLDTGRTSADLTDVPSAGDQGELSSCIEKLSRAIAGFVAHGSVGARLPRSAVVLGKGQSRLRALRKEAVARKALSELRAGASSSYKLIHSSEDKWFGQIPIRNAKHQRSVYLHVCSGRT